MSQNAELKNESRAEQEKEHFVELMVSCINPLNSSTQEFQKFLLKFSFEGKQPDVAELKQIQRNISTAHHLVCDMIAEANRIQISKLQTYLALDDDFSNDQFDESN